MSKILVQGNTVHTPKAIFTEEDKQALSMYNSFEGFPVHNIKISQIFNEFTDPITTETFDFPEKVGEEDFWPEVETFCENQNKKEGIFLSTLLCTQINILTPARGGPSG